MAQRKKSSRGKTPRVKVMMVSTGTNQLGKPTKFAYYTYKNTRNTTDKMVMNKLDPKAWNDETKKFGKVVPFKEKKVPK